MTNWKGYFTKAGAMWMHDGNPARPHAILTSGLHSDGFVNCTRIMQDTHRLVTVLGVDGLRDSLPPLPPHGNADWVVGSAMGAITFAYAVAERLCINAGFTEKDGDGMKLARFEIEPDAKVLVVEDVISTGGSTLKTIEGIKKAGVAEENILPYIVCLVNRSGQTHLGGREIRALLTLDIHNWQPEECPLCKAGSKALRPKANWKELVQP